MGVGNYTEDDIKECARAFTGWTVKNGEYMSTMGFKDSIWPYGRIQWHYEFREEDHDAGIKTFLGEQGPFDGQDIIEIISRLAATARFIARHIYNYFIADEVPVPQWSETTPRDPDAIAFISDSYHRNEHSIKEVLRDVFNSQFFKESAFMRVKSPAELVIGTLRKTGEYQTPVGGETGIFTVMEESGFMGQKLLDPPSVEGWHTGMEWIDGGTLTARVNFAVSQVEDTSSPGLRDISLRLSKNPSGLSSESIVDGCLEMMGMVDISDDVRGPLIEYVKSEGDLSKLPEENYEEFVKKISNVLKLAVSTIDYQFA